MELINNTAKTLKDDLFVDENPPKCFWKNARIVNSHNINVNKIIKDEEDGEIKDADSEQG